MPEWNSRVVTAVRIAREPRLPGSPPLVAADDDHYYWVKTNTSSDRSAAHEAASCTLTDSLGLSTPSRVVIDTGRLPRVFDRADGTPSQRLAFGSRLHSEDRRPYDYMPTSCLGRVKNLDEIVQWAAFDVWVANAVATQPVFYGLLLEGEAVYEVRALKISHSQCFAGFSDRSFDETHCRRPSRYQVAAGEFDCSRIMDRIGALSADDLRAILESAPQALLDARYRDLLWEGLRIRQKRLAELMTESLGEMRKSADVAV